MDQNVPPRRIKWFIYYMVILSVPMVLGMAIYFHARYIIEQNSEEVYAAAMEQARSESDALIHTISQTLDHLIADRNVQKLTFLSGASSPDDVYSMYLLVDELRNYPSIFPIIDDIFVSLNSIGLVLGTTGSVYRELYLNTYYPDSSIGCENLAAFISQNHRLSVLPVGDRFLFLKSTLDSNLSTSSITAAVAVKRSRFIELFSRWSGDTAVFIFDNTGDVIASSAGAPELPNSYHPDVYDNSIKINGRFFYPLTASSRQPGWIYLCLLPLETQRERVRQIQLSSIAGLLICSFFSLFFSMKIARESYSSQMTIRNDLEMLRKFCIYTLLEKPWDGIGGPEEMKKYQIKFPGENVMVLFFVISEEDVKGREKALSEQEGNRINLVRSYLIKTFRERAGKRFLVEMTDVGENTAAILNWSGPWDHDLLEDDIEETQRDLESRFLVSAAVVLGGEHILPEGIYASSLEAGETLLYLDPSSGQSILHYRDIRNAAGVYQFPPEMEQKLINLIRMEDGEAACQIVRQLADLNTVKDGSAVSSGPVIRVLAADILGAVMKGQGQVSGLSETGESTDALLLQVPVRELVPSLERIIMNICTKNQSAGEKKSQKRISEKIQSYIRENFRNPDINISQTGYHFDMSPFYLSRLFKEETGSGLLEYINILRVEEGKKLITEGYSITRASEMTGFRGSNAFIRVFKKITGLTPGQYKEME